MNIGEIKQIGEIIGSLGDKTVNGLIMYLSYNLVIEVIGYAVGIGVLVVFYKLLLLLITRCFGSIKAVNAMKDIRDLLNTGSSGTLMDYEIDSILAAIKKLKQEKNK